MCMLSGNDSFIKRLMFIFSHPPHTAHTAQNNNRTFIDPCREIILLGHGPHRGQRSGSAALELVSLLSFFSRYCSIIIQQQILGAAAQKKWPFSRPEAQMHWCVQTSGEMLWSTFTHVLCWKRTYSAHIQLHISIYIFSVSTVTCLHVLMFKKLFIFFILCCASATLLNVLC